MMAVSIKFCGAAGVVTGSCYLVTVPGGKFLVDCGLFQGTKTVRELNYGRFGFDPSEISFVLLTHAHIDHSGLLPKLVKQGFTGKIYTTEATADLLHYMLPDSAYIQESEVSRLNKRNRQRNLPEVEPIYISEDAEQCLQQIEHVKINGWADMPLGVRVRFWDAGHILGSASIEAHLPNEDGESISVLFSGDLGPDNKTFMNGPESPNNIDYLVVESTYGDRERVDETKEERREILRREILEAAAAGGNILIPAFAVERTQELLLDLDILMDSGALPEIPLFIDSPLATRVTEVFKRHYCGDGSTDCPFHGKNVRYVQSVEESKGLNRIRSGAIIMAASGMCEAGRIRHHLRNNLWDSKTTILFVGYQAEGTLGRLLQEGTKTVRIHGTEIGVNARIRTIDSYSAHADRSELMAWVKARFPVRGGIFLTHGIDEARQSFRKLIAHTGFDVSHIVEPVIDEVFRLRPGKKAKKAKEHGEKPRIKAEQMTPTDWHNDYARFVLDLAQHLRGMQDGASRTKLLKTLRRRLK